MRINKYIATCGITSRRKAEELITTGQIKVNDTVVTSLSYDVQSTDTVKYNNCIIRPNTKLVYIMLNKPTGYITTVKDEFNRKTVLNLVPHTGARLFPVGRLDYNTSGLIILTNDGQLANKIIHPSSSIAKTYIVTTAQPLTLQDIKTLEKGIVIDGYKLHPCKIQRQLIKGEGYSGYKVTIYEGRNREIRKMFEYVNNKVNSLSRISIGKLELGDLPVGKYKKLTPDEINKIFM